MSSATQPLRSQLDRARRAWRASPLPRFFAWWGGELLALLPHRWRGCLAAAPSWYLLKPQGDDWQLHPAGRVDLPAQWNSQLDAADQQVAFADAVRGVDSEDLRVALCLRPDEVLRPRLTLPLAARDNLQQIGAFEMDRQTPFRAEQVHYDVRELDVRRRRRAASRRNSWRCRAPRSIRCWRDSPARGCRSMPWTSPSSRVGSASTCCRRNSRRVASIRASD